MLAIALHISPECARQTYATNYGTFRCLVQILSFKIRLTMHQLMRRGPRKRDKLEMLADAFVMLADQESLVRGKDDAQFPRVKQK